MMKERSLISSVGVLLYVVLSFIDKFIYKIEIRLPQSHWL